jgi:hypothetical protein
MHANQCRYMLSFQHGPTRASTCWALDTRRNLHSHTRLSNRENTHQYMLSSRYGPTHAEESWLNLHECWDMQNHAQLLMLAHTSIPRYKPTHAGTCQALDTCRSMCATLSSWYWPTFVFIYYNKDSPSALDKCRKMQKDARLSTGANTLSALNTFKHMQPHSQPSMRAYTCWDMSSSQNAQTHADTRLIRADTCIHALHSWYRQTNTDTRSALNMCRHTLSSRGTGRQALSFQHRKLNEDASSALDTWSLSVHKDDPGSQ